MEVISWEKALGVRGIFWLADDDIGNQAESAQKTPGVLRHFLKSGKSSRMRKKSYRVSEEK